MADQSTDRFNLSIHKAQEKKTRNKPPPQSFLPSLPSLPPLQSIESPDYTAFCKALDNVDFESAIALLREAQIYVDTPLRSNETILSIASERGSIEVAQCLVEDYGANVNHKNEFGRSVLMKAAVSGNLELVHFLLHQGASLFDKDKKGRTALDWAKISRQQVIVASLQQMERIAIEKELACRAQAEQTRQAREIIRANREIYTQTKALLRSLGSHENLSSVTLSEGFWNDSVIKLIGNDLSSRELDRTSWEEACFILKTSVRLAYSPDHEGEVWCLDVENRGWTLLTMAITANRIDLVHWLYQRGTFIDWTTKIGHTPLTWACVCRLPEMVKELLILGADPNLAATIRVTRSNNDDEKAQSKTKFKRERVLGQTPLHYACIQGSSEITESLIQRIRDLCIMESLTNNKKKFFPLENNNQFIEQATPNPQKSIESTSLELLSQNQVQDWVQSFEIKLNCENSLGKTPLQIAREYENPNCVEIIQNTIDLNRAQRNQVLSEASRLKVVKCPLGCGVSMKGTWIGSHIENDCENREIQCTNQCGEKVVACMLENHLKKECSKRYVRCRNAYRGCNLAVQHCHLVQHMQQECEKRPLSCRLGCGQILPADQLTKHETTSCKNCVIPCLLNCSVHLVRHKMGDHIANSCLHRLLSCPLGCEKSIPANRIEEHIKTRACFIICRYNCGESFTRSYQRLSHETWICLHRLVKCKWHCGQRITAKEREMHEENCQAKPIYCSNCNKGMLQAQLPIHSHWLSGSCNLRKTRCLRDIVGKTIHLRSDYVKSLLSVQISITITNAEEDKDNDFDEEEFHWIAGFVRDFDESNWKHRISLAEGQDVWVKVLNAGEVVKMDLNGIWECGEIHINELESHMKSSTCKLIFTNCPLGCDQRIIKREIHKHVYENCKNRESFCSLGCGEFFKQRERFDHEQFHCKKRLVLCECKGLVAADELKLHKATTCLVENVRCGMGCGKMLPRALLNFHYGEEDDWTKCINRYLNSPRDLLCIQEQPTICADMNRKVAFPKVHSISLSQLEDTLRLKDISRCEKRAMICSLGCNTTMWIHEYSTHVKEKCLDRIVKCKLGCGQEMKAKELENHQENLCQKRSIFCPQECGEMIQLDHVLDHCNNDCTRRVVQCTNGCKIKGLILEERERHEAEECPLRNVVCPYGCGETVFAIEAGLFDPNHNAMTDTMCFEAIESIKEDKLESNWWESIENRHIQHTCRLRVMECPWSCGARFRAERLSWHLSLCDFREIPCSLTAKPCVQSVKLWLSECTPTNQTKSEELAESQISESGTVDMKTSRSLAEESSKHDNESTLHSTSRKEKRGEIESKDVLLIPKQIEEIEQNEGRQTLHRCERHKGNILVWGVYINDIIFVESLLKRIDGRAIELETTSDTALTAACGLGNIDMVHTLLNAGADLNHETSQGRTPLGQSCISGHLAIVELLLRREVNFTKPNRFGKTPIELAKIHGHDEIVSRLALEKQVDKSHHDLIFAVVAGNAELVKDILKGGEGSNMGKVISLQQEVNILELQEQKLSKDLEDLKKELEVQTNELTKQRQQLDNIMGPAYDLDNQIDSILSANELERREADIQLFRATRSLSELQSWHIREVHALVDPPSAVICRVLRAVALITELVKPPSQLGADIVLEPFEIDVSEYLTLAASRQDRVWWPKLRSMVNIPDFVSVLKKFRIVRFDNICRVLPWISPKEIESGRISNITFRSMNDNGGLPRYRASEDSTGGLPFIEALAKWLPAIVRSALARLRQTYDAPTIHRLRQERQSAARRAWREIKMHDRKRKKIAQLSHKHEIESSRFLTMHSLLEKRRRALWVSRLLSRKTITGHTALDWACTCGHVEVMTELLRKGANSDISEEETHNAARLLQALWKTRHLKKMLEKTAFNESWKVQELFDSAKRRLKIEIAAYSFERRRTRVSLTEACYNGRDEVVRHLLARGVKLYRLAYIHPAPSILRKPRVSLNQNKLYSGYVPLSECVKWTPLECAILGDAHFGCISWRYGFGWGEGDHKKVIKSIEKVESRRIEQSKQDKHNIMQKKARTRKATAIRKAVQFLEVSVKSHDVISALKAIQLGATVDQEFDGITPLMMAAELTQNVQLSIGDVKDVIGIHIEAMAPQEINKLLQPRHPVAMMMELSRIKPTVSLMNRKFGHTALTWATLHGRSESVEALLYNGAQASEKTTRGSPALCIAAKNGMRTIIRLLLMYGADPMDTDARGRNAAQVAESANFLDVAHQIRCFQFCHYEKICYHPELIQSIAPCPLGCSMKLRDHEMHMHLLYACENRVVPCPLDCSISDLWAKEVSFHVNQECPNRQISCSLGCGKLIMAKDSQHHIIAECDMRPVPCPYSCALKFSKAFQLSKHMKQCESRPVSCPMHCGEMIEFRKIEYHTNNTCSMPRLKCTLGCGLLVKRGNIKEHVDWYCPYRLVDCSLGCGARFMSFQKHLHENASTCVAIAKIDHEHASSKLEEESILPCPLEPITCRLGCSVPVARSEMDKHCQDQCPKRFIACVRHCGLKIIAEQMEAHIKSLDCLVAEFECSQGCGEKVESRLMKDHLLHTCLFRPIKCALDCGENVPANKIEHHRQSECTRRIVTCPRHGCQQCLEAWQLEDHMLWHCKQRRTWCTRGCGEIILVQDQKIHDKECVMVLESCPLGCGDTALRRHEIHDHITKWCIRRTIDPMMQKKTF